MSSLPESKTMAAAKGGNDDVGGVDAFDAFGLRDDDDDDNFDTFTAFSSTDPFAATPLPPPPTAGGAAPPFDEPTAEPTPIVPSQAAINKTDSHESDPFGFDDNPFQSVGNDGGGAARGFKKSPPSSPTPPNTSAVATETMPEADDFDIGPPSSAPFTAEETAAVAANTTMDTSASFTVSSSAVTAAASAAAKRAALPPRLGITLFQHEEVISQAAGADQSSEVACAVTIEGKVHALVQSSDASQNCPFQLIVRDAFTSSSTPGAAPANGGAQIAINRSVVDDTYKVTIPKSVVGNVPVASYRCSSEIENMPVLVQSKVRVKESGMVHVDVQIRSNLNNKGDLANFAIAAPCPSFIDGGSILITKGEGAYDELKRVVKWKRPDLPRGESFLVGFEAKLAKGVDNEPEANATRTVPILLRCLSNNDQISGVEVDATAVSGHPAAVHAVKKCGFRLLHRAQSS